MKLLWTIGAALLALAAAPAAGQAPPPPPMPRVAQTQPAEYGPDSPPRPAIWLLSDADTKIYLFGTFHILPPNFRWRSAMFDDIARRADELVVEVSDRETISASPDILAAMALGKQAPLLWRVAPERREALTAMAAEVGVPLETFDGLRTWVAAFGLSTVQIIRAMNGEDQPLTTASVPGVEDQLEAEFIANNRPISGVETAADQMGIFGAMSFAEQRGMLEAMIDEYSRNGLADVAATGIGERQWVRGEIDALGAELREMPEPLYDAMLRRRNAAWTEWLTARLERPGTLLFAVGAAHLAGPDSVQTMLEARGLTARRIQ